MTFIIAALLTLATLTDVLDGVVARRLGVTTEWLRRADSLVDTTFYVFVAAATLVTAPDVFRTYAWGVGAVVALRLLRGVYDHRKFGKQAAYHMWSAKAWGLALLFGFTEVFLTGHGGFLFKAAIALGVLTNLEGLAASVVLPRWRHDLPSLFHAVAVRNALIRA